MRHFAEELVAAGRGVAGDARRVALPASADHGLGLCVGAGGPGPAGLDAAFLRRGPLVMALARGDNRSARTSATLERIVRVADARWAPLADALR
jgi:hypothetical protein